jgi:ubiquinone/menaquinone biosynthesis C-methylase UbiE
MKHSFEDVTELSGSQVSREQIHRMFNRYFWTAQQVKNKDVLEVACGVGQGVGLIGHSARSIVAGDFSESILERARAHYGDRYRFMQFDAQDMPFEDNSFDAVVIHEALYYVPDASKFVAEAKRVLRPGGRILLTNSNKDLYDFNPSPHSYVYHGTVELGALLGTEGFDTQFWGSGQLAEVGLRQKLTRPAKRIVVGLGLMPKSMESKRFLKRLIFGKLLQMPAEITPDMASRENITQIPGDKPCRSHK